MACRNLQIALTLMISFNVYLVHTQDTVEERPAALVEVNKARAAINVNGIYFLSPITDAAFKAKLTVANLCGTGMAIYGIVAVPFIQNGYLGGRTVLNASEGATETSQMQALATWLSNTKVAQVASDGTCKNSCYFYTSLFKSNIKEGLVYFGTCAGTPTWIFILKQEPELGTNVVYLPTGGECGAGYEFRGYPESSTTSRLCQLPLPTTTAITTTTTTATTTTARTTTKSLTSTDETCGATSLISNPFFPLTGVCLATAAFLRA